MARTLQRLSYAQALPSGGREVPQLLLERTDDGGEGVLDKSVLRFACVERGGLRVVQGVVDAVLNRFGAQPQQAVFDSQAGEPAVLR